MLKYFLVLLLSACMAGALNHSFAQSIDTTKLWTLNVGVAIPAGAFAKTDIAPSSSGYARPGFMLTLDSRNHIYKWIEGLTTLGFSKSGFAASKYQHSLTTGLFSSNNVSAKSYTSLWVLYGPEVQTNIMDGVNFYFALQAGVLISNIPEISIQSDTNSLDISAPFAPAFAYGAAFGFRTDDYELGFRYYSGGPRYDFTYLLNAESLENKIYMPTVIFQLSLGYNF